MELSRSRTLHREVFMVHATHLNAALTVRARLRLAQLITDDEWPIARAAERYDVSWETAAKWACRYAAEGPGGLYGCFSRPPPPTEQDPATRGPQDRADPTASTPQPY